MVAAGAASNPRGLRGTAADCPEHDSKKLRTFWIVAGHPVRDIVKLAADLNVDLLVIGATGDSALYERIIASSSPDSFAMR